MRRAAKADRFRSRNCARTLTVSISEADPREARSRYVSRLDRRESLQQPQAPSAGWRGPDTRVRWVPVWETDHEADSCSVISDCVRRVMARSMRRALWRAVL